MQNRFNLIDEPWIPAVGKGFTSLGDIFSDPDIPALGGNPVQKIALTKLLLAIGQAACTPETTEALEQLDAETFRAACRAYLETWRESFWLFGERPFLQMPAILDWMESQRAAGILSETENAKQIGPGFYPSLPSDNDSILSHFQTFETQTDAEKALFIVSIMNFAFGGTQMNKNIYPSTEKEKRKGKAAKPGPSLGTKGYLHTFLFGSTISDTLIMNLLSKEEIGNLCFWKKGIGTPPWENMPISRECDNALSLQDSYMGTLVSLSRFVLLHDDGIYYIDGLPYTSHYEGWLEPSMTIGKNKKGDPEALQSNPALRPWRELVSILAVFNNNKNNNHVCLFVKNGLNRWPKRFDAIGVWSGGLQITTSPFKDQYAKGKNDFVESSVELDSEMWNDLWYEYFCKEISTLDNIESKVSAGVTKYYDSFEIESQKKPKNRLATKTAEKAVELFWQLAERLSKEIANACRYTELIDSTNKKMRLMANQSYDAFCPKETARQIDAWAKYRPYPENSKQKNMNKDNEKKSRGPEAFVPYVIALCQKNKGAAAALRRADNPATETQSWEYLAKFIDLDKPDKLAPYAAIAAAIARADIQRDGAAGIGKAIALCYPEKSESAPAQARFRRLLACDSVKEACRILRPLFSLIDSKAPVTLDYAKLLDQLLWFNSNSNRIKTAWATDFYRHAGETANEEVSA